MISKNKNLFLKIYITFVIIISVALIILTKDDIKNLSLESHNIKNYSEELPNIYISNWMLYYGYTKKLILIRVED